MGFGSPGLLPPELIFPEEAEELNGEESNVIGFKSQLCHLPAMWSSQIASDSLFLCLSFFVCKMVIIIPTLLGCYEVYRR